MKQSFVLAAILALIVSVPAYLVWRALPAQTTHQIKLNLVDAGSVTNSAWGFGIFMQFEPQEMPEAGLRSIEPRLLGVCNQVAPQVVAQVKRASGATEPKKVVILVRSCGMIGSQLKVIYDWVEGRCV